MRPPHLPLSLAILLLPWLATALPQEVVPEPSAEATTTSTSTSTLTVTRTLIRGTAVVIATLPIVTSSDVATSTLPDIAVPTSSAVPSDIILAPPNALNSTLTLAPSATGTGVGKPLYSTTGPPPASFTGGAATLMGAGGAKVAMMGFVMALIGALM